jgi:hypothetical protein
MTVEEMTLKMSSRELSEWRAFDALEPIGWHRVDLAAGIIAAILANQNRKRGAPPFKPIDFMPFVEEEKQEIESVQDLRNIFKI